MYAFQISNDGLNLFKQFTYNVEFISKNSRNTWRKNELLILSYRDKMHLF